MPTATAAIFIRRSLPNAVQRWYKFWGTAVASPRGEQTSHVQEIFFPRLWIRRSFETSGRPPPPPQHATRARGSWPEAILRSPPGRVLYLSRWHILYPRLLFCAECSSSLLGGFHENFRGILRAWQGNAGAPCLALARERNTGTPCLACLLCLVVLLLHFCFPSLARAAPYRASEKS